MITTKGLQKKFKSYHALRGVDLHVKKGEIYGFIGHNGAGKSTTMNIIAGLSRPTEGECIVNGLDVRKIRHPSRLNIGYLPEDPRFFSWMSAFETLEYLGNSPVHKVTKARINEMLGWVGLEQAARRRVGGFSRGMKQRLGMAASMIHNPELLILDEPSSALDPEGRSDVLRLISELKQMGKTVLFSTHILSDVERVCDTVGMIASGKIVLEKPLSGLQSESIRPIFDITLQTPSDLRKLEILKSLSGVRNMTIQNDALTVITEDVSQGSLSLLQFFSNNNIPVQSIALRKNTLEDIFIQEAYEK